MSSATAKRKVAVLGAAGGIGQPLGLLMKLNPLVTDLSLYDIAGTPGVASDISHINTLANVSRGFVFRCFLWLMEFVFCS
jgi:malate dehydrogenase